MPISLLWMTVRRGEETEMQCLYTGGCSNCAAMSCSRCGRAFCGKHCRQRSWTDEHSITRSALVCDDCFAQDGKEYAKGARIAWVAAGIGYLAVLIGFAIDSLRYAGGGLIVAVGILLLAGASIVIARQPSRWPAVLDDPAPDHQLSPQIIPDEGSSGRLAERAPASAGKEA